MKKALLIIMTFLMVISVTACGGNDGGNGGGKDTPADPLKTAVETYGLDLASTEEQTMSSERATKDQLSALKHEFFKDTMMFEGTEFEKLTYADIKEEFGVDASYYCFEDDLVEKQCFVWQADGNDAAKILISFTNGILYGLGSANIG